MIAYERGIYAAVWLGRARAGHKDCLVSRNTIGAFWRCRKASSTKLIGYVDGKPNEAKDYPKSILKRVAASLRSQILGIAKLQNNLC